MPLAINLIALLLVLGLCWGAMMWLSDGFHGHGRGGSDEVVDLANRSYETFRTQDDVVADVTDSRDACMECEGVGAQTSQGRLALCPECLGTGVLS